MLQTLPTELLWGISVYLPPEDLSALSQTCHHCYIIFIPAIYQKVILLQPGALFKLSKKLFNNPDWLQRAKLYVHNLHIVRSQAQRALARHGVFEHICSGWEDDGSSSLDEDQKYQFSRHMHVLVNIMLVRFPNLSNFVMDFDVISQCVTPYTSIPTAAGLASQCAPSYPTGKNPFRGSVILQNYPPGNSRMLMTLLRPLAECSRLTIQTQQYLSLCAAIQDSLLADSDIHALADLGLQHVRHLTLAYIDDFLSVSSLERLMASMPSIESLTLEWLLPPSPDYSDRLFSYLADFASLYPEPVQRINSAYRVLFKRHMS